MSKIVKRTLDFIELFAEQRRPLSLSEISRLLGVPMSSCFDVIRSLQERGYLYELGQRGGYYPTQRIVRLAAQITQNDPILARADLLLRALRDEFDESIALSQATGLNAKYLLVYEPSHNLRYTVQVGGELRSLNATSVGKALLASLPPGELDAVLRKKLVAMTEHTITDPELLRRDLREGEARGVFVNREESTLTMITMSARFAWNRTNYFVTIAGPIHRMEPKLDLAEQKLRETARRLEMAEDAYRLQA
jgi:DNA-binding IclR family transcriptional regulator